MDLVTALAIVISIMGGGATWAAVTLGSPFVLIWAIFIAWASFFAAGGTPESLVICQSAIKSNRSHFDTMGQYEK